MAHAVRFRAFGLIAPLAVLVAGCGGVGSYVASPSNESFSIQASSNTVNTNGQVRFSAVSSDGSAAAVNWTIIEGQNDASLGQGAIDATGVYTPPAALDRDSASVKITAQSQSDASKTATVVLRVTPGFLQPLAPENAALTLGANTPVTAQIAEVSSGEVRWRLSSSARGGVSLDANYGTLSEQNCQRSSEAYTSCTVTYAAPASMPAGTSSLYLLGTVNGSNTVAPLHILLNADGVNSTPQANQAAQKGMVQLGASGGNNADYDSDSNGNVLDCCGGTLGALVSGGNGDLFILSNNHVLAESDHAATGDTIVQPGLIDSACAASPAPGAGRSVGALKYAVPLAAPRSNVDAALAAVNPGSVDPSGSILQLGEPSGAAGSQLGAAPPAGGFGEALTAASFSPSRTLELAKSGRTTGLTCSTVDAIHLTVAVDYFKDCAESQPYYTKIFTNQIGIPGNSFSDSGDSGALVVDASNAEPVGLFFAGGSDNNGNGYSVANPIQDVLGELGTQAGQPLKIVGGAQHPVACLNYDGNEPSTSTSVPEEWMRKAETAAHDASDSLVSAANGILGAAAGRSADDAGEPAVIVYVDRSRGSVSVPQTFEGIRTQVIATDDSSVSNGTAPKSAGMFPGIHLPQETLWSAGAMAELLARRLMADPAIFGVGVTQSHDNASEAALMVLVDLDRSPREMPVILGGLRVRYVFLHRFHVTRSKLAGSSRHSACSLPGVEGARRRLPE